MLPLDEGRPVGGGVRGSVLCAPRVAGASRISMTAQSCQCREWELAALAKSSARPQAGSQYEPHYMYLFTAVSGRLRIHGTW